jgi:fructose-1,6-bisphosphatase I
MQAGAMLDRTLAETAAPELGGAVLSLCEALAAYVADPEGHDPDAAISMLPVRWLLCRDRAGAGEIRPIEIAPVAAFAAALELLPGDRLPNPAGALFTLRAAARGPAEASFLTPPQAGLVAGCLMGGAETLLALAFGSGAALYALNRARGGFACVEPALRIPADVPILAADLGSYRHWDGPVRRFVDECLLGAAGPQGCDHAVRWSGALAADALAVLCGGGICLAAAGAGPAPSLILAGQPLARLAEAAGGRATDGRGRLLDHVPQSLAEVRAIGFGSPAQVVRLETCHDLPDADASPLFARRGLFRS